MEKWVVFFCTLLMNIIFFSAYAQADELEDILKQLEADNIPEEVQLKIMQPLIESVQTSFVKKFNKKLQTLVLKPTRKGSKNLYVRAMTLSPDGSKLAVGSNDREGYITIFDTKTWREIITIKHDHAVTSVAFSPDGSKLASGTGENNTNEYGLKVWDTKTWKEITTLKALEYVQSLAFSRDGSQLAVGSFHGSITILNTKTWENIVSLKEQDGSVYSLSFSPDGSKLASGTWGQSGENDKRIKIWDTKTWKEISTRGHEYPVESVAFSPDGSKLASGATGADSVDCYKAIKIWDTKTWEEIITLRGGNDKTHELSVVSFAFSLDGSKLVSGAEDCTIYKGRKVIKIWDTKTWKETVRLEGTIKSSAQSVVFSTDENKLIWGSGDRFIKVWNLGFMNYILDPTHGASPAEKLLVYVLEKTSRPGKSIKLQKEAVELQQKYESGKIPKLLKLKEIYDNMKPAYKKHLKIMYNIVE